MFYSKNLSSCPNDSGSRAFKLHLTFIPVVIQTRSDPEGGTTRKVSVEAASSWRLKGFSQSFATQRLIYLIIRASFNPQLHFYASDHLLQEETACRKLCQRAGSLYSFFGLLYSDSSRHASSCWILLYSGPLIFHGKETSYAELTTSAGIIWCTPDATITCKLSFFSSWRGF